MSSSDASAEGVTPSDGGSSGTGASEIDEVARAKNEKYKKDLDNAFCLDVVELANEDLDVITLFNAMTDAGCVTDKTFLRCQRCPFDNARAYFDPKEGVVLCENSLSSDMQIGVETVRHELVHAFDYCRGRLPESASCPPDSSSTASSSTSDRDISISRSPSTATPSDDAALAALAAQSSKREWSAIERSACTEIRAAKLSGECGWFREMQRRQWGVASVTKKCVRRRANLSVQMMPQCQDALAAADDNGTTDDDAERQRHILECRAAVDRVWSKCYYDDTPL